MDIDLESMVCGVEGKNSMVYGVEREDKRCKYAKGQSRIICDGIQSFPHKAIQPRIVHYCIHNPLCARTYFVCVTAFSGK